MGYPGVVTAQHRGVGPLSLARQASCDTGRIVLHVAPGAGFEPAMRRLTAVRVASFATPVDHVKKRADVPARASPWGNTGSCESSARVPPGSRTLLAGLEDRVLSRSDSGTNYEWSGQRELPPRLRLGKPACLSQHLGRDSIGTLGGFRPSRDGLASGKARRSPTRFNEMELRAGLAPACDEVAARRLSISVQRSRRGRRRRESNARDCRRPRFSGPACYHSSTSPNLDPPRRFERLSLDS